MGNFSKKIFMGIGIMTSVTGFVAFCANDLPIQDQDPNKIVIYSDIEKAPQKISKVVFMISGQKENSGNITMEMQGETIVVNKNVLGNVEKNTLSSKAVHSTIAGGSGNKIENGAEEIKGSAIVGGMNNQVTKSYSVIVGGENNQVNKEDSIILGGKNNTVSKSKTIVLGNNNKANGNGQESTVILGNNITENTNAGDNVLMGKAYTFQGKESFVWNTKTGKNIVGDKMFIINNDHGLAVGVDKTNGADVTVKGNFQIQEEPVKNAIITASGSIKTEKSCSCFYNGREWVARNGDLCGVVCNKTQGECGSELFKCAKGVLSQTVQTIEGNYRNCAGVENDIIVSKQCVICNTGYTNSNGKCVSINKKNVNCNPVSSPKIQNTTMINQTWDTVTQTYVPSLTGTYSATAIAGTCTFRCATGTVYDSAKDQCITYGCIGTIPANAGRNNNIIPNNNSTNYFYSLNTNEACSYSCNAGTYKLVNTCTKCPGSMTSVKASETITSCFATCNPGTYLKAKDSSCTQCPAGYSCPGGTFYYNENIDQGKNICGKDTYAQAGSAKCTNCPTKYHSAEGSVSISKCYLNVEEKKCKTNANGSETSEVQKGKYNESHISYYGSADNCNKNCTAIANATFTSNGSHATGCDFQCNNGYVKIGNACKKTCTINGTTLYEGDSIVMYETAKPAGECKSQVRTCTNGVLSGTYTNATCYNGCKKPWKKSEYIAHGTSLTGYKDNFQSCENPQATCSYQIRTCNNGVLSGSFSNESCSLGSYSCSAGTYPITGDCPDHGICESCTPYLSQGNRCNKGTQRSRLIGCEGGYHEYNGTCVENPSCGSSNGSSTHNAPRRNLCTSGERTEVITGSNSFKWTCKNGGEEVSCSAIRTYNSCPKSGSCNVTEHNGICIGYPDYKALNCEDTKVMATCNDGERTGTIPIYKECKEITQATLVNGPHFNEIIKKLAGMTNPSQWTPDTNIQSIQRASVLPSDVTTELISIRESIPIYAWYDQGTIYYYSESPIIFMNESATTMFYGLSSVKTINLSGINTSNVKRMDYMFSSCTSLTDLDISNFNTSNVTNMEIMFGNCRSLTNLDVSHFDTSNVTNMRGMFSGCRRLIHLPVSSFVTSSVNDMGHMFGDCESLTNLDLSNFDTSNVTDMSYMFQTTNLTSLDLSNFDTQNVKDMSNMFTYNPNLKTIYASEKFTTNAVETGTNMFYDSPKLEGGCNPTLYSAAKVDYKMAKIDKPGQEGYFTDKNMKCENCSVNGYDSSHIERIIPKFIQTWDGNNWSPASKQGSLSTTGECSFMCAENWTGSLCNEMNNIRITLDNQGATTSGTTFVDIEPGQTNIDPIVIPEKIGYVFEGYYTKANYGGTQRINPDGTWTGIINTTFTENTTLYAIWTKICTFSDFYGDGTELNKSEGDYCIEGTPSNIKPLSASITWTCNTETQNVECRAERKYSDCETYSSSFSSLDGFFGRPGIDEQVADLLEEYKDNPDVEYYRENRITWNDMTFSFDIRANAIHINRHNKNKDISIQGTSGSYSVNVKVADNDSLIGYETEFCPTQSSSKKFYCVDGRWKYEENGILTGASVRIHFLPRQYEQTCESERRFNFDHEDGNFRIRSCKKYSVVTGTAGDQCVAGDTVYLTGCVAGRYGDNCDKHAPECDNNEQYKCKFGTINNQKETIWGYTWNCNGDNELQNEYCSKRKTDKVTCSPGKYYDGDKQDCLDCPSGYYCPGTEVSYYASTFDYGRTACPTQYSNSLIGSTKESDCYKNVNAGRYVSSNFWFKECENGKYTSAHIVHYGDTSSCSDCPAGYYCVGGKYKEECPAGTYSSSAGSSSCTSCTAGKYSSAGASSCTSCPSGQYSDEGASGCYDVCGKNETCYTNWEKKGVYPGVRSCYKTGATTIYCS